MQNSYLCFSNIAESTARMSSNKTLSALFPHLRLKDGLTLDASERMPRHHLLGKSRHLLCPCVPLTAVNGVGLENDIPNFFCLEESHS
jgi:hypothetical protein